CRSYRGISPFVSCFAMSTWTTARPLCSRSTKWRLLTTSHSSWRGVSRYFKPLSFVLLSCYALAFATHDVHRTGSSQISGDLQGLRAQVGRQHSRKAGRRRLPWETAGLLWSGQVRQQVRRAHSCIQLR
ncbi:unnamed protein product, partial [Ectocarpus sp. 12 AP-2014]